MERSSRREFLRLSPRFDLFERFGQVNAQVIEKPPRTELRLSYRRVFEGSLILVLVLVIVPFRFLPFYGGQSPFQPVMQEIVKLEDIEQTRQENRPPPPLRPAIPIEVPSDEVLEDVTIASTEIDLAEEVAPPQEDFSEEEVFFLVVEEMPKIIGGMEELLKHIVYPEIALRSGIEGRVIVAAYVDERGRVVSTEVLRGLGVGLDEAAQRAVQKVKFIPGRQRGKPVKVRVAISVRFQIVGATE